MTCNSLLPNREKEMRAIREKNQIKKGAPKRSLWNRIWRNRELYLFLLPAVILLLLFHYFPMVGLQIAFRNYKPYLGFWKSEWVGLQYFKRFLSMPRLPQILKNTLTLSIYQLVAGFPLPVILALILNSVPYRRFKRVVQTVTYAPHFLSIMVIVGMIRIFFSPSTGIVRNLLVQLGLMEGNLEVLMSAGAFPHLYVWSGVWASVGWGSIIYLGALAGVDQSLHEAAIVDGATKIQRILHIDIPSILPTITILLIMDCGSILSVGFEKVFLMQNAFNASVSEVISTYVYKVGLNEGQYSLASAIGLLNSMANFLVLALVNKISKTVSENSLW